MTMLTKKRRERREFGGQASSGRKKSQYEDRASSNRSPSGNKQHRHNDKRSRDSEKGCRRDKPMSHVRAEGDKSMCHVHGDHEWYQCKFHPTGPNSIAAKLQDELSQKQKKSKPNGKGYKTSHHANNSKQDRASDVVSYSNYKSGSNDKDQVDNNSTNKKV